MNKLMLLLLTIVVHGCDMSAQYGEVGELDAYIEYLEAECETRGIGIDAAHLNSMNKAQIYYCPDGTTRSAPMENVVEYRRGEYDSLIKRFKAMEAK